MPSLPRPGDRLAGFRIARELGHGTTGVVYLAHQEGLDRRVALKVVGRPLADDAAFRERFRREARAVAGLDHPNVVQILATGEDDAHLWLAMRLVDGPDLRVLLRRTGRLDPEQAVAVVEQVAGALDAAHAAGLVHRDVKPGNVLIEDGPGRDLHVELADFGLARAPGVDATAGTPGYAAPEQLAGAEAGKAADVFALGCVLFELLTGTPPPAPAPARDDEDRVAAYAATLPLTPSVAFPRLGGAFDPTVERATEADPAARFSSAGELAMWARAALTVPRAAPDPVDPVRTAAATPASPAEVGPAAPTWEVRPTRRRRRGRRLLVAAFLVVVLALLGTAFAFIGSLGDASRDRRAGTTPGASAPQAGGSRHGGAGGGSASGASGAGGPSGRAGAGAGAGGTGSGGAAPGRGSAGGLAGGGGSAPTGGAGAGIGAGGTARAGSSAADGAGGSGGSGSAGAGAGVASSGGSSSTGGAPGARAGGTTSPSAGTDSGARAGGTANRPEASGSGAVPNAGRAAPTGATTVALPPVPAGHVRFGGGGWVLDLPAAERWRQTATQELDGGARIVTRLQRPDNVRLAVEALPGRTAVVGVPGARAFPVRLPDAGRTDGALYRGGRYAMCATGVCAAFPGNGPNGGVVLVVGAHRAAGAKRVARRAATGLRVR